MRSLRSIAVFALAGVLVVGCGGATNSGSEDGAKGGARNGEGGTKASGGEGTNFGGTSAGSGVTGGSESNGGGFETGGTRSGGAGGISSGGAGGTRSGGAGGISSGGAGGTRSGGAGGISSGGAGGTRSGGAGGISAGGSAGIVGTGGSVGGNPSGGASGGSGGSAGQGSIQCTGTMQYFPEFDRSCLKAEDCVAVAHQTNCCGARLVTGISASEQAAFEAAEAICDQQYPACGCAAFGTDVEDGTRVDFAWKDQVKVVCDAGSCKAQYSGTSFACGTARCTEQQYCIQTSGGPAGTQTSYSCNPTACTDCSCIIQAGCTCSKVDGHLTVVCLRP
jgi:hypothetical protein